MIVCGVLLATPTAIYSPGLPLALFAWSITEIIRYGFYGFNLLGFVPSPLVFLRYVVQYDRLEEIILNTLVFPTGTQHLLSCIQWA